MVRVINIDTKTKTIKISNEDKIDWITVKGTHVPIKEGEDKGSAVKKFVEKKRDVDYKDTSTWSDKGKKAVSKFVEQAFGKGSEADKTTKENLQLKESATEWYANKFKRDKDMAPKGTFEDIYTSIKQGKDPFDDSIVRERVFEEMSKRLNKPYEHLYDMWLNGGEKGSQSRIEKQKKTVAEFDKLLKTNLDPDFKKQIIAARDRAKKEIQ